MSQIKSIERVAQQGEVINVCHIKLVNNELL